VLKFLGEALGLSHAIHWVHDLRFDNVDFSLDSKKVEDNFHKGSNDVTTY